MLRSIFLCLAVSATILPVHTGESGAQATVVTLDEALNEAHANNPTLKKQNEVIKSVKAKKWLEVLPGNPEFFIEEEGIPENDPPSEYEVRKIGLEQEFEFPAVYAYRLRYTALEARAQVLTLTQARNETSRDVRKAFYRTLMLKAQNEVYRETLELARRILTMAEAKVRAGESTAFETLRAKVDVAEADRNLSAVSKELTLSLYTLKQMMGREKHESVDVDGDLAYTPITIDVDALKETAMSHHPVLRQHLITLEQRQLDRKMAKASLFPSISLGYFRQSIQNEEKRDAWGGRIGVSIPLWSIWKERGEIASAAHETEAAGWRIEEEKRSILLTVEEASNSVSIAQETVENYEANMLNETSELVRIAERQYEEGEAGYLELIEATRTMQRARAGYYDALYDCLAALADLEYAVGAGIVTK